MRTLSITFLISGAVLLLAAAGSVLAGIWFTDGRFYGSAIVFFILAFIAFVVGDVTRGLAKNHNTEDWSKK